MRRRSGDFGDFASFVTHMKELALVRLLQIPDNTRSHKSVQKKDVDLLLIDSGDLHDGENHERHFCVRFLNFAIGTGLTDGFPAGGVDAHDVYHLCSSYASCLTSASLG